MIFNFEPVIGTKNNGSQFPRFFVIILVSTKFTELASGIGIEPEPNAENKTISLNEGRGNQIHILNHC